jgi:hypothetical protein
MKKIIVLGNGKASPPTPLSKIAGAIGTYKFELINNIQNKNS